MPHPIFDHEKLDVYRLSLDYVAKTFHIANDLTGQHRHSRDPWRRACQSIPLNIAEGNGKHSLKDRARFFDIGRGSALECAAIQDVLVVSDGLDAATNDSLKATLKRIVAMLTRLAARSEGVSEASGWYDEAEFDYDYEHEHRCAEHE